MPDDRPPFDSRDLIRHLPELLAGPEPILESARAREVLRGDPLAEASLLAVAEAVNAMEAGAVAVRAGRRGRRPTAARPIAQAARHFARGLAGVLFDLGRAYVNRAIGGEMWLVDAERHRTREAEATRRMEAMEHVAAALHEAGHYALRRRWLHEVVSPAGAGDRDALLCAARELLLETTRLVDPAETARWYLLLIREQDEPGFRADEWERYAAGAASLENKALAWEGAARLWAAHGRPDLAVVLNRSAERLCPGLPGLAYNGLLHSLLAGEVRESRQYVDALDAVGRGGGAELRGFRVQALRDKLFWTRIRADSRDSYDHVVSCLGPSMAGALEEVTRS
ncbi:MAG: hypothetical protein HY812_19180 [Planctomycetes bacterium]|nr:hypothetical protein [Planctomycetota bacterium]